MNFPLVLSVSEVKVNTESISDLKIHPELEMSALVSGRAQYAGLKKLVPIH